MSSGERGEASALRRAHEARGRMLASQRWIFLDREVDLRRELDRMGDELTEARRRVDALAAENANFHREVRWLRGLVEERTGELEAIRATRTFRYTAALRRGYERLRHLLGRR